MYTTAHFETTPRRREAQRFEVTSVDTHKGLAVHFFVAN